MSTQYFFLQTDARYVTDGLAPAKPATMPSAEFQTHTERAYHRFVASLGRAIENAFVGEADVKVAIVDGDKVADELAATVQGRPAVSLHPLVDLGDTSLRISRLYTPGGMIPLGEIARPGAPSLESQLDTIKAIVKDEPVTVVEDDCFSGGTLSRVMKRLTGAGVSVGRIVVGLDALSGPKRAQIESWAPQFDSLHHIDPASVIDLSDVRDFILGAEGLVVRTPDGEFGRVPYFAPFASASARLSMPGHAERVFSREVIEANTAYFGDLAEAGIVPLLVHAQPGTATLLSRWCGAFSGDSMFAASKQLGAMAEAGQFFPKGRDFGRGRPSSGHGIGVGVGAK